MANTLTPILRRKCKKCGKPFYHDNSKSQNKLYCNKKCKNSYAQKVYEKRLRMAYRLAKEKLI